MFYPWIGARYGNGDNRWKGRKLLVVGESHYGSKEDIGHSIPEFTRDVVRGHIEWKKRHRFFSNIATLLIGVPAGDNRKLASDVWDDVAFYNYVPVVVADGPRKPINPKFWEMGQAEFNGVLDQLEPHHVLVFSSRLWAHSFYRHGDGKVTRYDSKARDFVTRHGAKHLPSLKFPHATARTYRGLAFSTKLDHLVDQPDCALDPPPQTP